MKDSIAYLGHIITIDGITVDPKKVDAIRTWDIPQNPTQVQSFLGLCNYYRRFVKDSAKLGTPLSDLTKKDKLFEWGKEQQKSFDILKKRLTETPVLRCANPNLPYELTADASGTGIVAVLTQKDET